MYLLYLSESAEPANFLSSSHYPAWPHVVLHKHTLGKPLPQTECGVARDRCSKVAKERDPHQGCLSLTLRLHGWGQIQTPRKVSLLSQSYLYRLAQGIILFDLPFLLCAFSFQTLPSPGGSDWDLHRPKTLISICVSSVSTLPWLYHYSNFSFLAAYHNWVPKQAWDPGHTSTQSAALSQGLCPSWCWSWLGIYSKRLGKKVSQIASLAN